MADNKTVCVVYIDVCGREIHYLGVFDTHVIARECLISLGAKVKIVKGNHELIERIFVTQEFIDNLTDEEQTTYFQESLVDDGYWFSFEIIETNKIVHGCSSDYL
jgi:hypothetical protein